MKLVLPEVPLAEADVGQVYLMLRLEEGREEWVFGALKVGRKTWVTEDGPDRPYNWPTRLFESPRLHHMDDSAPGTTG